MPMTGVRVENQLCVWYLLLQDKTVGRGRHDIRVTVCDQSGGFDVLETIEIGLVYSEGKDGGQLCFRAITRDIGLALLSLFLALMDSVPPLASEGSARLGWVVEEIEHGLFGWRLVIVRNRIL